MSDPRLRVLAALLSQGRTVHLTTGVLTLGTWFFGADWPVLVVVAALGWAAETWFAARVGMDATLFDALANGTPPSEIDRGLAGLGLVAERTSRPIADRIRGAVRLWRIQLVLAILQGLLFVAALGVAVFA